MVSLHRLVRGTSSAQRTSRIWYVVFFAALLSLVILSAWGLPR